MLILMTSPDAVLRAGVPNQDVVDVLATAKSMGHPVGIVSNHPQPHWFEGAFSGTAVQFLHSPGRQNGAVVSANAKKFKLNSFDVLVLANNLADVQMGKNGGAILVAAGWSTDSQVCPLGIRVEDASQLNEVIKLMSVWSGAWWYSGSAQNYDVRALADLSGYGKTFDQQAFASKLTATVKRGGPQLNALLAITARSVLTDGLCSSGDLVWGVYPSSNSDNTDNEILSDFTHRLRTTTSRVHFCKRGEPLFVRHSASTKRSGSPAAERIDPTEQIQTLHLNPFYRDNRRLVGKHVIVVDDCTTYGVSFAVAAAFLRKAGAGSVTGLALGKFGNQLGYYEIDIQSDPFAPVSTSGFTGGSKLSAYPGTSNQSAQHSLQSLIP